MKKTISIIGKTDDAELMAQVMKCKYNNYNANIFIRWGVIDENKTILELNTSEAISVARNKFETLKRFSEHNILTPKYSENIEDLKYPVLGRKYCHQEGKDIVFIKNEKNFKRSDYYIEFLPVQHEFRYHIINNECIIASIKRDGDKDCHCRNLSTGWKFVDISVDKTLEKLAVKSVKALGLDFGAVDIIISKYKPYVLEVNTALGIIKRRAKLYANKFNEWIDFMLKDKEYINRVMERSHR